MVKIGRPRKPEWEKQRFEHLQVHPETKALIKKSAAKRGMTVVDYVHLIAEQALVGRLK